MYQDVSEFAVLPGAVPRSVVAEMLQLLESDAAGTFDEDPDTVMTCIHFSSAAKILIGT